MRRPISFVLSTYKVKWVSFINSPLPFLWEGISMKRVLLIAYEGRVKGDEKPFDRVEESSPLAVVLGAGDVLKGLEEVLSDMEEGEEREVELPPEKAFGERNPDLVVIIPEREFRKRGITPYPGLPIEADGRTGRVLSVSAGRVQVDFNHPLAGKTLIYKVKVVKVVEKVEDAAFHLFRRFFGYEPEDVSLKKGVLKVSYMFSREAERAEPAFVSYILMNFDDIKEVRMEKIYRRKESKEGAGGSSGR